MPTTDTPASRRDATHATRSFAASPDSDAAIRLLDEIADGACAFSPVAMDRPLALYGAGSLGKLAREFLTHVGSDFTMVVDRRADELAAAPYWTGVALKRPDAVPRADKQACRLAVSIVTSPYAPIERALIESGFTDVVPFYDVAESFRDRHPLSNGWFAPALTTRDRENTAKVLSNWHDDTSRAHHLQFLAWRRLREEWTFDTAPVLTDSRFFIPEVTSVLRDDETFVDAGAHHGSVTQAIVERTGGAFKHIAAIEPDAVNRSRLTDNLNAWLPRDPRIAVHDFALGETESQASFYERLDYASQLTPLGSTQVAVRPLDAVVLSPTFLKLHLEGGELGALKGARQVLLANRPIVAATVYHNAEGIWETPLWLMQTLPDYQFLFRTHGWCGTGAVVYGVPQERRVGRHE